MITHDIIIIFLILFFKYTLLITNQNTDIIVHLYSYFLTFIKFELL